MAKLSDWCMRLCFLWNYHVVYFFKTIIRKNPDSCTGYEIYLVDRILLQVIPLTYGNQRVGNVQKIFIVLQLVTCIYIAVECYMFHVASLRWFDDAVYTLWEFVTWVQFPLFIFFHLLSARYRATDASWSQMVLYIVAALVTISCVVTVCTIMWIPRFPIGRMEHAWAQDYQFLDKPEHRPEWIMNMQRPLECCGYREPNDWIQGKSQNLPYTCCAITTYTRNCTLKHSFVTGCLWRVKYYYGKCRPMMVLWAPINVLVVVFNYGLYRYLFKRNSLGWQHSMVWREALLPVLHVEKPALPLQIKQEEPLPLRLTESEAIADIIAKYDAEESKN